MKKKHISTISSQIIRFTIYKHNSLKIYCCSNSCAATSKNITYLLHLKAHKLFTQILFYWIHKGCQTQPALHAAWVILGPTHGTDPRHTLHCVGLFWGTCCMMWSLHQTKPVCSIQHAQPIYRCNLDLPQIQFVKLLQPHVTHTLDQLCVLCTACVMCRADGMWALLAAYALAWPCAPCAARQTSHTNSSPHAMCSICQMGALCHWGVWHEGWHVQCTTLRAGPRSIGSTAKLHGLYLWCPWYTLCIQYLLMQKLQLNCYQDCFV